MADPPALIQHLTSIIQKCRTKKNPTYAKQMLRYLCDQKLEAHTVLGNYLVPMLVDSGCLSDAQHVFDRLRCPNEYSWSSLITGYVTAAQPLHAHQIYLRMQEAHVQPNSHMHVALLKACSKFEDLEQGHGIHDNILKNGREVDPFIGSAIVDMYSKCGSLIEARRVFDTLSDHDVVSWMALITGYVDCGYGEEAQNCFELMQLEGVTADDVVFLCSLKACALMRALRKGRETHSEVTKRGLEMEPYIGNTLVDLYAKCGSLAEAQQVFDKLPVQDAVAWAALISGYADHGYNKEVLKCLKHMQLRSVHLDSVMFARCLKACGNMEAIEAGREVHSHIGKLGLDGNVSVGNVLLDMYCRCGSLAEAVQVFEKLSIREAPSWNALIAGYHELGHVDKAKSYFEQMFLENGFSEILCVLKGCGIVQALEIGKEAHSEIIKRGTERGTSLGNALVSMYAKSGSLLEAWQVFDNMSVQDGVGGGALILGHTDYGFYMECLNCFEQIQLAGVPVNNVVAIVACLKACGMTGALRTGQEIENSIRSRGLDKDVYVGNTLVHMYCNGGLLPEAQHVFNKLHVQDVVSWNTLIAGYNELGFADVAHECYEKMKLAGVCPNAATYIYILKSCSNVRAGCEIHNEIIKRQLAGEAGMVNALVDMYASFGSLPEACQVFKTLAVHNEVSWAALIRGYSEYGNNKEVLDCFRQLKQEGMSADAITLVCCLGACGTLQALQICQEIHGETSKLGLECNDSVGIALISAYAKCGASAEAQQVFDKLHFQDVASWDALIEGYTRYGLHEEALRIFEQMQVGGVTPQGSTSSCSSLKDHDSLGGNERHRTSSSFYVSLLKACRGLEQLQRLHTNLVQKGLEQDLLIGSSIAGIYGKCCSPIEAHQVFDKLPMRDTVSWTSLLGGYAECGLAEEALSCFEHMWLEGIFPDDVTFLCSLKACGMVGALEKAQEVHAELTKRGLERELHFANTVVDAYAKCGSFAEANEELIRLPVRDAVTWAVLISGYAKHGHNKEVLKCFKQMQQDGVRADSITLGRCLSACGSLGVLETGREIHGEIGKSGFEGDLHVGNLLIDMYAKCGSFAEGWEVFDKLPVRDAVSWTTMIKGYGKNDEGEMAVKCFEDMQELGMKPDAVTFTCLLAMCSHASFVLKGHEYFKLMRENEVGLRLDHLSCMVDLLARSGHVDEAEKFAAVMQSPSQKESAMAMLCACKSYGKVELGLRCLSREIK